MPNQFNDSTIQQYGGVAWAKQQMDLLDPNAIQDQIDGYNQVKSSLSQIVDALKTANSSLQSAWTGDAASSAAQTFTDTSNHAQNVITTVNDTVTQLQTAKTAAANAKTAMSKIPDEKPVPGGGIINTISNAASDLFTGTDPTQQAQQHNTAVRTQAAQVLNQLSDSYDKAATNLNSVAGTSTNDSGFNPSNPNTGSFNLGGGSYGGGSGAAKSYTFTPGGGGTTSKYTPTSGVKNGVFDDSHTSLQGAVAAPPPAATETPTIGPNLTTTATTTTPAPVFGLGSALPEPDPQTAKSTSVSEENLLNENGEGSTYGGGKSKLKTSNVFGEEGFGEESGSGYGRGAGSAGGSEQQTGGVRGAGGRGGAGGDEEELESSKYSRGRFFGGDEPDPARDEWIQPAVGGDESLLVKGSGHGSGTGRVTSAYQDATDADGNPLHLLRGVGRRGIGGEDEEDERGERPGYLKEDPEWWQSAQEVAPPVVE
jgi:uncharacterized protein YukE